MAINKDARMIQRLVNRINRLVSMPHISIREYCLGADIIAFLLGTLMHNFLLDIPRLGFTSIIPALILPNSGTPPSRNETLNAMI